MDKFNQFKFWCGKKSNKDAIYHNWLVTSVPPNSYSIEIGYVDTLNNQPTSLSSYKYDEIRWIDMPFRFTNWAQANAFGSQNYTPILFRVSASSDEPNYFKYS